MDRITGNIKAIRAVKATINAKETITGKLALRLPDTDIYNGAYEITPNKATQILKTSNKLAIKDIIIEPIPNNYGLITWNGRFIKVS